MSGYLSENMRGTYVRIHFSICVRMYISMVCSRWGSQGEWQFAIQVSFVSLLPENYHILQNCAPCWLTHVKIHDRDMCTAGAMLVHIRPGELGRFGHFSYQHRTPHVAAEGESKTSVLAIAVFQWSLTRRCQWI